MHQLTRLSRPIDAACLAQNAGGGWDDWRHTNAYTRESICQPGIRQDFARKRPLEVAESRTCWQRKAVAVNGSGSRDRKGRYFGELSRCMLAGRTAWAHSWDCECWKQRLILAGLSNAKGSQWSQLCHCWPSVKRGKLHSGDFDTWKTYWPCYSSARR